MTDTYVYIIVTTPDGRIMLQRTRLRSYVGDKSSYVGDKTSVQLSKEDIYTRWKATIAHKVGEEKTILETAERAIYIKFGIDPKKCGITFRHVMTCTTKSQKTLEIYKFQLKSDVQLLLGGSTETRCLSYENIIKMMQEDRNGFTGDTIDVMNVSSCFIQ